MKSNYILTFYNLKISGFKQFHKKSIYNVV